MPDHSAHSFPRFTLLAKPVGAACNLECSYCFYREKEQLYPGSDFRMNADVLEAYIRQRLACQPTGEVEIAWQGGEPTLIELNFYQHAVELVKKYKTPRQRVVYSLQTNGTLLDDEWCAFFKKHDFLIGISLDGPADLHNTYRVNKAGRGSFERASRGWNLLQQHQVETNILCAVHAANACQPIEVYSFFRDTLAARFIQFIPIVEKLEVVSESQPPTNAHEPGNLVNPRSVGAEQYGRFLSRIFDEWVRHDVGSVFVQNFEVALASWCHLPSSVCTFQEVCGRSLILEHNGDLYSCDHFVDPAHRLGNILERPMKELVESTQQDRFGLDKRERLSVNCQKCPVKFACWGECPRNRFLPTPGGEASGNYLCPSYKFFFRHIDQQMRWMANLLRRGLPAAEIMRII